MPGFSFFTTMRTVCVDPLQRGNNGLAERLVGGLVCTHPYVVGELALGNLKQRATVLEAVQHLPPLATATDPQALPLSTPTRCTARASATSMFICWLLCF